MFVPGPGDAGPSSVLPQPPLRKQVTAALREKVPGAVFTSNPCRLRFYNQQVVIFRGNVQARMRRLCLVPPTGELGRAARGCMERSSSHAAGLPLLLLMSRARVPPGTLVQAQPATVGLQRLRLILIKVSGGSGPGAVNLELCCGHPVSEQECGSGFVQPACTLLLVSPHEQWHSASRLVQTLTAAACKRLPCLVLPTGQSKESGSWLDMYLP